MQPPDFWSRPGALEARLLAPAAYAFALGGRLRRRFTRPFRASVPVICIGNLTVGGTGKTPTAMAIAMWLQARGHRPHILTRGYKGSVRGPVMVDLRRHGVAEVGDEALLLARVAPTWVARNRAAAARMAHTLKADALVLDDGFQNPSLTHDCAIVVIDGGSGFGNAQVLPAGPLREWVDSGLARATAVLLVGEDEVGVRSQLPGQLPVIDGTLVPERDDLRGVRVLAFAGIGRPDKFFKTLQNQGVDLVEAVGFSDHHPFTPAEIEALLARARQRDAKVMTTAKDFVRVPLEHRGQVDVLEVRLRIGQIECLERILQATMASRKFTVG